MLAYLVARGQSLVFLKFAKVLVARITIPQPSSRLEKRQTNWGKLCQSGESQFLLLCDLMSLFPSFSLRRNKNDCCCSDKLIDGVPQKPPVRVIEVSLGAQPYQQEARGARAI